jgi:hypothetical protein
MHKEIMYNNSQGPIYMSFHCLCVRVCLTRTCSSMLPNGNTLRNPVDRTPITGPENLNLLESSMKSFWIFLYTNAMAVNWREKSRNKQLIFVNVFIKEQIRN